MHGHHRLRLGRRSDHGRIYLVTAVTRNRERYFADWTIGCAAARALASMSAWPDARPLCWVLMPDHWHAVVELADESLELAVGRVKAIIAREVGRTLGRPLPLWAPCFHDHALRRDESLIRIARYVVGNPLRAGLVEQIGDWPFWDAVWLEERRGQQHGRDAPAGQVGGASAPTGSHDPAAQ